MYLLIYLLHNLSDAFHITGSDNYFYLSLVSEVSSEVSMNINKNKYEI